MSYFKKRFFLGANTPQGFVSRFDQLSCGDDDWHTFILKGGPGTGKSTMLKQIATKLAPYCPNTELIHCSSDLSSLDGIILHDLKVSFADGTSPHVLEPTYPGVSESLIMLGDCWNREKLLENKEEIKACFNKKSSCHKQCCKFLAAGASLLNDTYCIAMEHTDTSKIYKYANKFVSRELKPISKTAGKEEIRFLSAVTAEGIFTFDETPSTYCDNIILVQDEYGVSSKILLNEIKNLALANGYNVVSCYCPLSPFNKIDHLFIKEANIGFMTLNKIHEFDVAPERIIHSQRFSDVKTIKEHKNRIQFNKKAALQMFKKASNLLGEAKQTHQTLESYYHNAMDYEMVSYKSDDIINMLINDYMKTK